MIRNLFFIAILLVPTLFAACDKKSGKKDPVVSASLSSLEATGVVYQADPGGLLSTVTVTLMDPAGLPVPKVRVRLVSDRETDQIFPSDNLQTDTEGKAVFSVQGRILGTSNLTAHFSSRDEVDPATDPALEQTASVTFDFGAALIPLDATYTHDQGEFLLRLTLTDSAGPIIQADFQLISPTEGVRFPGSANTLSETTNNSGTATFTAMASNDGLVTMDLTLDGVQTTKPVSIDFPGPSVAGTVFLGQAYPSYFMSSRVGAMAIRRSGDGTVDLADPILQEITSESVCPCPTPSGFELRLPIQVGDELLNLNETDQVLENFFPVVVYDDRDNDYLRGSIEPLLGARLTAGVLRYRKPAGDNPVGTLGWHLVDGIHDNPTVLDWDFFNSSLDVYLRRCPKEELLASGTVENAGENTRVAFFAINGPAVSAWNEPYPVIGIWVEDYLSSGTEHLLLADVSAAQGTWDAQVLAPELSTTQQSSWKVSWNTENGEIVEGYLILAVAYEDANANGGWDPGEPLHAMVKSTPGTAQVFMYLTRVPMYDLFRNAATIGIHPGYNRMEQPELLVVTETGGGAGEFTFTFSTPIAGFTANTEFAVYAASSGVGGTPLATGSVTGGSGLNLSVPMADCQNCHLVNPGDLFILGVSASLTNISFLDWTEIHFTTVFP